MINTTIHQRGVDDNAGSIITEGRMLVTNVEYSGVLAAKCWLCWFDQELVVPIRCRNNGRICFDFRLIMKRAVGSAVLVSHSFKYGD